MPNGAASETRLHPIEVEKAASSAVLMSRAPGLRLPAAGRSYATEPAARQAYDVENLGRIEHLALKELFR